MSKFFPPVVKQLRTASKFLAQNLEEVLTHLQTSVQASSIPTYTHTVVEKSVSFRAHTGASFALC